MNPETKKLRERTREYHKNHPQYAHYRPPERTHRKKRYTHSHLTGKEVCYYCGVKLNCGNATFDHIIPLSKGGADTFANLVWCCKKCNKRKGSKMPSEWYAYTDTHTDK